MNLASVAWHEESRSYSVLNIFKNGISQIIKYIIMSGFRKPGHNVNFTHKSAKQLQCVWKILLENCGKSIMKQLT